MIERLARELRRQVQLLTLAVVWVMASPEQRRAMIDFAEACQARHTADAAADARREAWRARLAAGRDTGR